MRKTEQSWEGIIRRLSVASYLEMHPLLYVLVFQSKQTDGSAWFTRHLWTQIRWIMHAREMYVILCSQMESLIAPRKCRRGTSWFKILLLVCLVYYIFFSIYTINLHNTSHGNVFLVYRYVLFYLENFSLSQINLLKTNSYVWFTV